MSTKQYKDMTSLSPEANPFLEAAMQKASAFLNALLDAISPESTPDRPEATDARTKLLMAARADVDEFLDAVRAELSAARRKGWPHADEELDGVPDDLPAAIAALPARKEGAR